MTKIAYLNSIYLYYTTTAISTATATATMSLLPPQKSFLRVFEMHDVNGVMADFLEKSARGIDEISVSRIGESTSVFVEADRSSDCRAIEGIFITRLKEIVEIDPMACPLAIVKLFQKHL